MEKYEIKKRNSSRIAGGNRKALAFEINGSVEILFDEIAFQANGLNVELLSDGSISAVLDIRELPMKIYKQLRGLDGLIITDKPKTTYRAR